MNHTACVTKTAIEMSRRRIAAFLNRMYGFESRRRWGPPETACKADDSYCAPQSTVGVILSDEHGPIRPKRIRISSQARSAIGRRATTIWRSFRQLSTDPIFPILVLGVIPATYFFAFVLNAPANVVLGILFIGCLTAIIETKRHNDRNRQ